MRGFMSIAAGWELVYRLAIKDLKVRYKEPILGFLWIFLNPLLQMAVLSIVFTLMVRIPVENYPAFLLAGLVPWVFLSHSLLTSTPSIVEHGHLIKKVRFHREAIPLSINLANLFNFLLSLSVMLIILTVLGVRPGLTLLALPLPIFIQLAFNIGASLLCAGLHAYYRDVRYLVEALLIAWFYMTPILYPLDMVPKEFLSIYMLNPMAGIVTMYRDILIYGRFPGPFMLLETTGLVAVILVLGILVFRRYEPFFSDLV